MKTTQYFRYTRQRPDRAIIQEEWIERAVKGTYHDYKFDTQQLQILEK